MSFFYSLLLSVFFALAASVYFDGGVVNDASFSSALAEGEGAKNSMACEVKLASEDLVRILDAVTKVKKRVRAQNPSLGFEHLHHRMQDFPHVKSQMFTLAYSTLI